MLAQLATNTATPNAGLQLQTIIPIPNWTATGATQASVDIFSFDPVTRIMYFADRVNHGVDVINTQTNTYLGTIPVPSCQTQPTTSSFPSGVQVAADLRRLVVTDRLTGIFVYDLTGGILPTTPIASLTGPSGQDEMDYDPLNKRVYIANTESTVLHPGARSDDNMILGQIGPLAESPEQTRWNPTDGLVYTNISGNGTFIRIDPTQGIGVIMATVPVGCAANGNDVDPVTNTALLGCSSASPGTGQAQMELLTSESSTASPRSPGPTSFSSTRTTGAGTRLEQQPEPRHRLSAGRPRGQRVPAPFVPIVGVFSAGSGAGGSANIVGAQCPAPTGTP